MNWFKAPNGWLLRGGPYGPTLGIVYRLGTSKWVWCTEGVNTEVRYSKEAKAQLFAHWVARILEQA